ncbi:MAG TPA: glycosyltransferase family 2 protein [Rhodothermales bacterium]
MQNPAVKKRPELSFVMPCYNEEATVGFVIPPLLEAFTNAGYEVELVAVDNGSTDRTAERLLALAERHPQVRYYRVEVNEGYGNGILQGIGQCQGDWIATIPADGQVDPEDVVRLYRAVISAGDDVVGKVRRRFRMDGFRRKVVSVLYNLLVRILWPRLESLDVNGIPKMLPRRVLQAMDLKSKNWLLDPEIMIKAHYMGIRVLELNAFARMRGSGVSHVRATTCLEFFRYLLAFRFSRNWREDFQRAAGAATRSELSTIGH